MQQRQYMASLKSKLSHDGYLVLDKLFFPEECDEMLEAANAFTKDLPEKEDRAIFSSTHGDMSQLRDEYFINSNDKIRPFFEKEALDDEGNLVVEPKYSLNKVGHALHLLHPLFRVYTYCDRIKSIVKALNFQKPAVVQSMVIFKNPGIGAEVVPHQDATYLYSEPIPPLGFWVALEDADVDNGCLWVIRGSHRSGVHRRLLREPDEAAPQRLVYNKPAPTYSASSFVPVPVAKGSCIILHGNVIHKSHCNKSKKGRLAYTFHVIEREKNKYSSRNWLQEGKDAPFCDLYDTMQLM